MANNIAIGIQSFDKLREAKAFYIDKTLFIKEWWEKKDDVTLITRPRRFGKTLNMSMIEQFFSVEYANRGDLFEDLSIWKEEKYRDLQGTYPVISLSFANIKEDNYEATKLRIYQTLIDLYNKHDYLLESNLLNENEKEYYSSIKMGMLEVEATLAIHKLSDFLYRYYDKKAIILLDEYDTPMQEAYVHGFWDELVRFTRSLFNSMFKTNTDLGRAIMTGITRVSRESMFSDLNNLKVVTTTSKEYATSFGFMEEEVFAALETNGLGHEKEKVKEWYDGFVFGNHEDIYNPWSILNFLDTGEYATYCANTSSNSLVSKLICEGSKSIKTDFEVLLRGETITCPIDEQIVYNQLNDTEDAIWSLLLACGYLKVLKKEECDEFDDDSRANYELAFTNKEVRRMFRTIVRGWFGKTKQEYGDFINALLLGDLKAMNYHMKRVTMQTFSYFDTGKGPFGYEPEKFYHGFVLGLLVDLNKEYIVTSNRESGFGRYDVMLEPRDKNKPAMVLEFKVRDEEDEKNLQETVEAALKQIEEKQYETNLIANGVPKENIRKYGFAFEGKNVLIGAGTFV